MKEHQDEDLAGPNSATLISDLVEVYGFRFLRFVLALPDSWELGDEISTQQNEAAVALYSWIQAFRHMDSPNRFLNLVSLSTRRMVSDTESNAVALRRMCGGEMEAPQREDDEVFTILVQYARDVYPAFLIENPEKDRGPWSSFASPDEQGGNEEFYRAVLRDSQLKYLFPDELRKNIEELDLGALRKVASLIYFEVSQGGTFQLPLLIFHLLNSAFNRCAIAGDDSFQAYVDAVAKNLSDARSLAAGRTAKVPVVLGLSNINISGIDAIPLPGGLLRKVVPGDSLFLPPQVKVDALLVLDMPMKISHKGRHPEDGEDSNEVWHRASKTFQKWREDLQWHVDCHRLAFMLSNGESDLPGIVQVLQVVVNPLQGSLYVSWSDGNPYVAASRLRIEEDGADGVSRWVNQVTTRHPRSLRVAMRRILSAASSRTDPSDKLVDAVLAWENIFSDSPETSLRVCGSLSLLLEPTDREKRRSLLKELNEIYSTRSAIVHGNSREPTDETVREHGGRAIEVAVEAMRRLYENPDLLNAQNASVRGRDVLLGLVEIRKRSQEV
ncbi:hypothetical protein ACFQ7W_18550 [Streptomyces niveus]|uniref:hypothetical protein n=1 Tax=Streptomyces niveus TaxID=193462 RepID=UPI00367FB586